MNTNNISASSRKRKWLAEVAGGIKRNSHGFSLIEALIAMAILGAISAAFLNSLATAYKADALADQRTSAESLVRSEFEYIKDSPYQAYGFSYEIPVPPGTPPPWDAGYTDLADGYQGYSVEVTGQQLIPATHTPYSGPDMGIQQITVEVYYQGELLLSSSTYKINR
jgi:prepilin-type N-terminal cleavage/methylation domain-containing protein